MTGIIDHPDNLQLMSKMFFKTLLWVLKISAPNPIPEHWSDIAVNYLDSEIMKKFPMEWYKHLCMGNITHPINKDPIIALAVACYALVEVLGLGGYDVIMAGPKHIYDTFQGIIPKSLESSWLENDENLKKLIIKAYRYAFKTVFDQVSLGDYETHEELKVILLVLKFQLTFVKKKALQEFDTQWHIGNEDEEWQSQMVNHKENLFSLSFNEGVYNGHILRLDTNNVMVGKLSSEVVKGIWASLNLELLYITNDDDERYSIQAHPTLLRNITIQSSEPPLGYPTYAVVHCVS